MREDLTRRVLREIERSGMFRPGDRVGVGVSGGGDSVALLLLLNGLRLELGIQLCVLHFNHGLRGAESDGDERFVAALAAESSLEFAAERADVAAVARERRWNLEDAGRRLRYAFFRLAAGRLRLARVAVAHTADDQAETVLARLVRGTGPAGLAAIYPMKGCVVRPLLEVRRNDLRAYLEATGQEWREDRSNADPRRLRARLRQDVLPALERDLQPGIVAHLCRLAQLAREDEAFWTLVERERLAVLLRREGDRIGIRSDDLMRALPETLAAAGPASGDAALALARRLVRGIVGDLQGSRRRLTGAHVEQVLRLAAPDAAGHRAEIPGVVAERILDCIWFSRTTRGEQERNGAESENVQEL